MKTLYLDEPENVETRVVDESTDKKYFEVYMLPRSAKFIKGLGLAVILSIPLWLILLAACTLL